MDESGTAQINLEDAARGLGITKTDNKNGVEYIRLHNQNIHRWLVDFGFLESESVLPEFIPENIFYRLAMKAKNETAERFQAMVADEILPSIRKHGAYMAMPQNEKPCLGMGGLVVVC